VDQISNNWIDDLQESNRGSQKERMEMIMISLAQKGISQHSIAHYVSNHSPAKATSTSSSAATATIGTSDSAGIDL
jgi:hypothetical protein